MFSTLCLAAALACTAPADVKQSPAQEKHAATCAACAKACTDCQTACDICSRYCTTKVLGGSMEHHAVMEVCIGCGDACRFASSFAARHNPMACHAGECCMKCCSDAAAACEKYPDDKAMAECAKACRECERACKAMATK